MITAVDIVHQITNQKSELTNLKSISNSGGIISLIGED